MGPTQALGAASRPLSLALRRVVQEGGVDDLARRAVKGDRRAFSALMTAHKEGLYRFVRRRTRDPEEAYDIVQEAFVSAWSAISRYDPNRPFVAWLRSIALNKCRDRARRASVRRGLLGFCPEGGAERVADQTPSPEDDLIARDQFAALSQAMARLPANLREALRLTAVDGMSQAAASAVLGCSVKSIEYRVHRAREIVAAEIGLHSGV